MNRLVDRAHFAATFGPSERRGFFCTETNTRRMRDKIGFRGTSREDLPEHGVHSVKNTAVLELRYAMRISEDSDRVTAPCRIAMDSVPFASFSMSIRMGNGYLWIGIRL